MTVTRTINLFLDTEFTNFESLQLISIGIVSDKDHEFYLESKDFMPEGCSEFVNAVVLPKLVGGSIVMRETEIQVKLSEWLLTFVHNYDQVNIHMDFHADLIILDRLLTDFPYKERINCRLVDFKHLADKVNVEERETKAHHALWDAKDLYARWQLAASGV